MSQYSSYFSLAEFLIAQVVILAIALSKIRSKDKEQYEKLVAKFDDTQAKLNHSELTVRFNNILDSRLKEIESRLMTIEKWLMRHASDL